MIYFNKVNGLFLFYFILKLHNKNNKIKKEFLLLIKEKK